MPFFCFNGALAYVYSLKMNTSLPLCTDNCTVSVHKVLNPSCADIINVSVCFYTLPRTCENYLAPEQINEQFTGQLFITEVYKNKT